jgi:predicted small secreted protein
MKGIGMRAFASTRYMLGTMLSVCMLALAIMVLGACNTTAGVGEDVSAAGRAVTKGADKVKQGL